MTTIHSGGGRTILNPAQRDRAAGVLVATAAGDALGAGYEFGPPLSKSTPVGIIGGGGFQWAPGEWTDDTSMATVIARCAAAGGDLRSEQVQDQIAQGWIDWARVATDVGNQTRDVLSRAEDSTGGSAGKAAQLREEARMHHDRAGRSGGNGSLMRTAPVALAHLHDEEALIEAAMAISALTHFDPEAGEACALWCLAIRHAVLTGKLDARVGLKRLDPARQLVWAQRLDDAEAQEPSAFDRNGWVVQALQGAWSAITHTPVPVEDPARGTYRAQHLQLALEAAVRGGRDTDTVAAIAGGLLGATYGASAVPAAWRRVLHGWPGLRVRELVDQSTVVIGERPFDGDYRGYAGTGARAQHPHDSGLWLGGVEALRTLPPGVDAVVSLCRVSPDDLPTDAEHVEVRLIDSADAGQNPNLGFVLQDTVAVIEQLRAEGRTVLLHCVQAESRTPTVAALYGARRRGVTTAQALADVRDVLPGANPNTGFLDALEANASA